MEVKAREIGVGETKERRNENKKERAGERRRKEKEENNRSKKTGSRVGDLGEGRKRSKVRGRGKKASTRKILQVNSYLW